MKKQLISIYVALSGMLFASSVDVNVSQGTDQSVITSLTPAPVSREVDADTNIKLCFNEPLLPMRMPRSVTLTKLQENTKNNGWFGKLFRKRHRNGNERISGNINYDSQDNCLIFDPDNNLSVGFYEVQTKPLMIRNRPPRMVVSPISYRFYVPEVINGFKLPPEPDEDKNNETLLGIDFNDNGIRDDVERKIIQKYRDKIRVNLMFQYARADQRILASDLTEEKAVELEAEGGKAINCKMYLKHQDVYIKNAVDDSENWTYNIKKRAKKYIEYNRLLGGGVYGSKISDWNAGACEFDVESMLEERQ